MSGPRLKSHPPLIARRLLSLLTVSALVLSMITWSAVQAPVADAALRTPFTASYNSQENGAIALTGNSQMTCPTASANCANAKIGTATGAALNNNDYNMVLIDADADGTTTNSTSAELALPSGSTVLYALLVWGSRTTAGTSGVSATGSIAAAKFRTPAMTGYTSVTGTASGFSTLDGTPYQTALDVTPMVLAAGNGTYWFADMAAATGVDRYAGWSLVVAYRNPAAPLRDLRVFQGFADVSNSAGNTNVDIGISGFLTPASGNVQSAVGFVAWEGDRGSAGDSISLNGTALYDATRPVSNFFYSAISDAGTSITARNPGNVNNFGVDIGRINSTNVLTNSQTSATINLTTNSETYYPGIVTTQIDLFTPSFNQVSKTVTNLSGNSPAQPGDTLQYAVSLTNTGSDFADRATVVDALPANISYLPGSLSVTTNTGATTGAVTDAADTDIGEYASATRTVSVRAGTGATSSVGGTIAPNSTITFQFRATVDRAASGSTLSNTAQLQYRARTIAKDYTFTGNTVATPVRTLADLAVSLTGSPAAQTAGSALGYTATTTNSGPTAATNAVTTVTLPAGVTFGSATPPSGTTCTNSGQTVTCTTATLANGGSVTIPISTTVNQGTAAGTVTAGVTVNAATADDLLTNNSASASTTISTSADVAVTNTVAASGVNAGANATFTLTTTNSGPSTAQSVVLTDTLPVGLTAVTATSATGGVSCTVNGSTVSCPIGALTPGQQVVVTVVAKVAANVAAGTTLTNPVSVSAATADANGANNSASSSVTVATSADLAVTKTATMTPAVPGTTQTYRIAVLNNGPSDAQSVVVSDPAVAGVTARSASTNQGTCTITNGAVSCAIGTVAAGATVTVTVLADVAADRTTAVVNTATASSATTDPTAGNNSGSVTSPVAPAADLSLVLRSTPGTIVFGSPVSYAMTVTNNGSSQAAGVVVTDPLPAGITFSSSSDGCTVSGGVVTCPVGTLAVGASRTVTFTAATAAPPDGSTTVTNTGTVSATTADPVSGNNSSTVTSSATMRADVSLTKTTSGNPIAGSAISYTLSATNNGPSPANAVTITDTLPTGVTFTSATGSAGVSCTGTTTVSCTVADINAGGTATVTINGTIAPTAAGSSTNTATVSSTTPDDNSGNNTATSTVTIGSSADVGVVLAPSAAQAPPNTVAAGSTVNYTLTVTNAGPSTARRVVATGQVPPGMTPVLGSSAGACTVRDGTVTCALGTVAPGATLVIPLVAVLSASAPAGPVPGTAQVGSSTPDDNPANNTSNTSITAVTRASLAITQTVDPTSLVAGRTGTYTITVTNTGPSDAQNVGVTDVLDPALAATLANPSSGSCSVSGQQVSCSTATLAAGASLTVRIPFTIAAGATGTLTSTASMSSPTDPTASGKTAVTTAQVVQQASVRLTKTVSAETVNAGTALTYTLAVSNEGPSVAADVTVSDALPAGLTVLSTAISGPGSCTTSTGPTRVDCTLGALAVGAAERIVIQALVPADTAAGTVLTNTATAASPTPDNDPARRTATATSTVTNAADLAVSNAPVLDPVEAGAGQSYVVAISNSGPSTARGAVLTYPLPTGLSYVDATTTAGSCSFTAPNVTCAVGDVAPGGSVTVQLQVTLDPGLGGSTVATTASIASAPATGQATPDPVTANNTSTASQVAASRSDLNLTKTITSGPVVAGSTVTYLLTATNTGPSTALQTVVTDVVPAGTSLVSATASDGGSCGPGPSVSCSWPSLSVGANHTVTLVLAVPAGTATGTVISNSAAATSSSFDNNPASARATATATVGSSADVGVVTTLLTGAPAAGGTARWQIVVSNAGPSQAAAVTVDNPAPAGVTLTSATTGAGSCTVNGALRCDLGGLAVGGSVTLTLTGTLSAALPAGQLSNTTTVSSPTADPNPANNSSTATTATGTSADLSLTGTAAGPFVAGGPVNWNLTVGQAGPSRAQNVRVTVPVPAGVTVTAATVDGGPACAVTTSEIVCLVDGLDPGATLSVSITGTLISGFTAGVVRLGADVTADTVDPAQPDNTVTIDTAVGRDADLRLDLTGPVQAAAGSIASWQVAVVNAGPSDAQAGFTVIDFPAGITPVGGNGSGGQCVVDGRSLNCPLGLIAAGTTATVTVSATLDAGLPAGPVTVGATAGTTTPDRDAADNTDTADTTVILSSILSVALAYTAGAAATPGRPVGWTATVGNSGPSTATAVQLSLAIPTGVSGASGTVVGTGAVCTVDGDSLTCPIGTLPPGSPVQILLGGTLTADFTGPTLTAVVQASAPGSATASAQATVAATPVADVGVSTAFGSTELVAGAAVSIDVTVTNAGPSTVFAAELLDTFSDDITELAFTSSTLDCTLTGQQLRCVPRAALPPGATATVTVTGVIAQSFGDVVSTTATVTATPADPNPGNNSSTASLSVTDAADVAVLVAGPAEVTAGTPVSWTVLVSNRGPSDARDVVFTDLLPAAVTGGSATLPDGSTCTTLTGCGLGLLPAGETVQIIVTGQIPASVSGGSIVNAAGVTTASADPDGSNNTGRVTSTIRTAAHLQVTQTAAPDPFVPGRTGTFTIVVRNTGPSDAAGVTLGNPLPPGVTAGTPTTSAGGCAVIGGALTCTIGTLAAGAEVTITLPVTVDPGVIATGLTSTATASSPTADPDPTTRTGSVTVPLAAAADLTLTKSGPATVSAGTPISWLITLTNSGPSVARQVVITDVLPAGLTQVTTTSSQGSCTLTDGTLTCDIGNLAPGDPAVVQLVVDGAVLPGFTGGVLSNTATVSSGTPEPGPDPADGRSATATSTVTSAADLRVGLAPTGPATAGLPIGWTVTVRNVGPSTAVGVSLTDALPAGLSGVTYTDGAGTALDCPSAVCLLPALAPGESTVVRVSGLLDAGYTGSELVNEVAVTATTPDPLPTNNNARSAVPVGTAAHLSIVTAAPAVAVAGGSISWTLTVVNTGPSTAHAVVIDNPVPAGVTDVVVTGATCDTAVRCTLTELPVGPGVVITVSGTVRSDYALPSLTIAAGVTGADPDPAPNPDDASSTATTLIGAQADLTVTLTGETTVTAGGAIRWAALVRNDGPSVARGVTLTDTAPAGVIGLAADTESGNCTGTVCDLGDLAVGDEIRVTFAGTVDPGFTGTSLVNTVTAVSITPEPVPAPDDGRTASATSAIDAVADLALTQVPSGAVATAGEAFGWAVTIANNGPSTAFGVRLTDLVPAGLLAAGYLVDGTPIDCTDGVCALGELAPGSAVTVTIRGTVDPSFTGASLVNVATAEATTPGSSTADNSATSDVPAGTAAHLVVTNVAAGSVLAGQDGTWTVTVTNAGPSTAHQLTLGFPLPAGLANPRVTAPDGWTCSAAVVCTAGSLAVGVPAVFTVVATVADSYTDATLSTTATIAAADPDPTPNPADASSTATIEIGTVADLTVTNVADRTQVAAGGPVSWTVLVRNDGPSVARDVQFVGLGTEGLGALTVSSDRGTCGGTACALGDLAVGQVVVIAVSGTVDPAFLGSSIGTTATVTSPTGEPGPTDGRSAFAAVAVTTAADLQASVVTPTTVTAGAPATWAFTVTNLGPSTGVGVAATVTVPAALTGAAFTLDGVPVDCPDSVCALGELAPGAARTLAVTGVVDPAVVSPLTVAATVASAGTPDLAEDNNTASGTAPSVTAAHLVVLNTAGPAVTAGQDASWTLTVTNQGPSVAHQVVVALPLPDRVSAVRVTAPAGWTCDDTVRCVIAELAVGSPVTIGVVATLDPADTGDELTTTATVTAADPDPSPNPADASSTATIPVGTGADLALTQTPSVATGVAGEALSWTLTVTNRGPSTARGVVLTDLPAGALLGTGFVVDGRAVDCPDGVCELGDLAAGAVVTVVLSGIIDPSFDGSELANSARLGSATTELNATDNTVDGSIPVGTAAHPMISAVGSAGVLAGEQVSWTLTVTNDGPSAAHDVVVSQLLPAGVGGVEVTAPEGVVCDATVVCRGPVLPVGATWTIVITGVVDPGYTAASVDTLATVSAADPDPTPDPDDAQSAVTIPVGTAADLAITLTPGQLSAVAGQAISWTAVVRNDGPSVARGVQFGAAVPGVLGLTAAGSLGACEGASCALGDLAVGAEVTITLTGTVDPGYVGPSIPATVTVESATAAVPDGLSRTATASTEVSSATDLQLVVTPSAGSFTAGGAAGWTITVTNAGPSTAVGASLTALVPAGLQNVEFSGPGCAAGGCDLGTLLAGPAGAVTVTVTGTLDPDYLAASVTLPVAVSSSTPESAPADNAVESSVPVTTAAHLVVTTTGPATVIAGQQVSFTVAVTNRGPGTAHDVVLDVPIPAGVGGVTVTGPTGAVCDTAVRCTLASLPVGGEAVLVITGTVDPAYAATQLRTTASVSAADPDPTPDPADASSTALTQVTTRADVSVALSADQVGALAGQSVSWTAVVRNDGPSVARGVQFTGSVLDGVAGVVSSFDGGTCTGGVCSLGDLAVGQQVTVNVSGTVDAGFTGAVVTAVATVTSDTPGLGGPTTATADIPVGVNADLAITAAVDPQPLVPGAPVTYTLTVTNAGPSTATGIVVVDQLPASVLDPTVTSSLGGCTISGLLVRCTAEALATGAVLVITVSGTLSATVDPGTVGNTASVLAATPDNDLGNNEASIGATVQTADLAVAVAADQASGLPGAALSWTFTVTNSGPGTARGVVLTDVVPAGFTVTAVSADCVVTTDIVCALGDLSSGSVVVVTVSGTVGADVSGVLNTAVVVTSPDESAPADNVAQLGVPVGAAADLQLTVAPAATSVVAGTAVGWVLTVRNVGPADATGVVVALPVPTGVTDLVVPAGCVVTDQVVRCVLDGLAVGAEASFAIAGTVDPSYRGDDVIGAATVSSALPDPNPADNVASGAVAVTSEGAVTATKTANADVAGVGQRVTYTITVTAQGPSAALDVSLFEDIPDGGTVVSSSTTQGEFDALDTTWDVGTVLPGSPAVATVVVTYTGVGDTVNVVSISVEGIQDAVKAEAVVAVQAAPVPTLPPVVDPPVAGVPGGFTPGPTGTMAYTGAPAADLVRWAVLFLVLGLGFVVIGQRRRSGR